MPTTLFSYVGALRTGAQAGPSFVIAVKTTMFPQHATSGPGSLPVPAAKVLAGGTTGTAYSETIDQTQGGVSPYTYAVTAGSLPTGTSLNTSTGVISGTPTVAGTYDFTITVTDTNGSTGSTNFEIVIAAPSSGATNSGFVA